MTHCEICRTWDQCASQGCLAEAPKRKLDLAAGPFKGPKRHLPIALRSTKKTTLDLQRLPNREWIDQYGRIMAQYTDANGKSDIRPTGRVGTPPSGGRK